MSTVMIQLRLTREEGSLVRLLGLVRRKRFDVIGLHADLTPDGDHLAVQLTVRAGKDGSALIAHIEKLLEASDVQVMRTAENEAGMRAARVAS